MNNLKHLIFVSAMLVSLAGVAQVTAPSNVPTLGNYVGFDGSAAEPLPIRNDAPAPIQWWTDQTRRMTLGSTGNLALGNNQNPQGFVKFLVLQNRPVGVGVLATSTNDEVIGFQARVNTASSGTFDAANVGFFAEIESEGNNVLINRGFQSNVEGDALLNYGGFHIAKNAIIPPGAPSNGSSSNVGTRGLGFTEQGTLFADSNFGLIGEACGGRINIGVYGSVKPTISGLNCAQGPTDQLYAGYFVGPIVETDAIIIPSDENLKDNIEVIENASDLLAQLSPKKYFFKADEYDYLALPTELQYGLISQEVEEVLPSVIRDFIHPSIADTLGEVNTPELEIKGLKYQQFIPLLIAAHNEQKEEFAAKDTQISELEEKLESLEAQLTEAVRSVENALMHGSLSPQSEPEKAASGTTLGQNVPNPFTDHTRVDFELAHNAQVRLEISDQQGRVMDVLIDGQLSEGMHSIMIDGSRFAPGVYFYSLYANGELLTKKMIKR